MHVDGACLSFTLSATSQVCQLPCIYVIVQYVPWLLESFHALHWHYYIYTYILVRFRLYHLCNNKETLYAVTVQCHTCLCIYSSYKYTADGVFIHLFISVANSLGVYTSRLWLCVSNPTLQRVAVIYRGLIPHMAWPDIDSNLCMQSQ